MNAIGMIKSSEQIEKTRRDEVLGGGEKREAAYALLG